VDLERGADAQQDVGVGGQRPGALDRRLGEELAEEDDVGLERALAVAARDAVGGGVEAALDLRNPGTTTWRSSRGPR
jgi:hypothetical protein